MVFLKKLRFVFRKSKNRNALELEKADRREAGKKRAWSSLNLKIEMR